MLTLQLSLHDKIQHPLRNIHSQHRQPAHNSQIAPRFEDALRIQQPAPDERRHRPRDGGDEGRQRPTAHGEVLGQVVTLVRRAPADRHEDGQ